MPTARPIIVMMKTTKLDISIALLTSAVAPAATKIESSASTIGSPAATAAPNTTSRMTSATTMPIISPCCNVFSISVDISPSNAAESDGRDAEPTGAAGLLDHVDDRRGGLRRVRFSPVSLSGIRTLCPSLETRPCSPSR